MEYWNIFKQTASALRGVTGGGINLLAKKALLEYQWAQQDKHKLYDSLSTCSDDLTLFNFSQIFRLYYNLLNNVYIFQMWSICMQYSQIGQLHIIYYYKKNRQRMNEGRMKDV